MKFLSQILVALILFHSCKSKQEQNNYLRSVVGQCDELDIVYYAHDTFVFRTIDTGIINFLKGLVTSANENLNDTCKPTGQVIYRQKGKTVFIADVTTENIKDSISCEYVTYVVNNTRHRHRLTYRQGMFLDGIYWHKVDPTGNPLIGDSTKFKYEEKKHSR